VGCGLTSLALLGVKEAKDKLSSTMVGKLLRLDLVEPHYRALIERADVETVVMNRHVELRVHPCVVDTIIDMKGEGQLLRFKIENGTIVEAKLMDPKND
jgi:hypothetical protein